MSSTDARSRLEEAEGLLSPQVVRDRAVAELNELFRAGAPPDPALDGFMRGRAITSTIWAPFDAFGRRLAGGYMPWLGKSFDAAAGDGVNILRRAALGPLSAMWPGYKPLSEPGDRIEAFRFVTRVAPGAVDEATQVLKIDYDLPENPAMIIRRILDELVQIEDGLFLGKVLNRSKSQHHPIGFFLLER